METPPLASDASTPPSSAAEQARLRRERREAKIKAGGSARLGKITSLSGRPAEAQPPTQPPSTPTASSATTASPPHADPDEIDISQHFYAPSTTPRGSRGARSQQQRQSQSQSPAPQISDDQLRQMMLDGSFPATGTPPINQQQQQENEDPMARMLAQMLGGEGSADGQQGIGGGLPPGLAQMMMGMGGGGATGAGPMAQSSAAAQARPHATLWRIVHAVFSFSLGFYVLTNSPSFDGSKAARTAIDVDDGSGSAGKRLFYIFATAQLILQSARFFLERGRVFAGEGFLPKMAGVIPGVWGQRVGVLARYAGIWEVLVRDAMVCVFVLGVGGWLKGAG
ncbi:MAG: hypothetical protein M1833_000837 [Piccolia ochrophora]|nr:MAG: hypothetical protein M1833_000837 [Piccolia ochrophora]